MLTQKYVQYRRARPKRLGPNIPNMELTTKRAGKSCRVEPRRSLALCWDRLARISSYEKEEKKFSLRLSLSNVNSYSFIDQAYASSSPRTKSQADVQYSVRRPNEPADYQWDYTTNCWPCSGFRDDTRSMKTTIIIMEKWFSKVRGRYLPKPFSFLGKYLFSLGTEQSISA